MGAFLENPMFLFVDNAEPILPIFRTTDYDDTDRIVELADVGCDTEVTFPIHFPRGAFPDRRRGGAEGLRSTRRIAKWFSDKPNESSRGATNNNEGRNRSYVRGKTRRDDYVRIADLDYDDSYVGSSYDELELPKNDFAAAEEDEYHAQFVNSRNAYFHRERVPRYDYSRDLESSFKQSIRVPRRESTSPRWFAENDGKDIREMHANVQLGDRKKRTKTLSRTNGRFSREEEFGNRERDDLPNVTDPPPPTKNIFWDFIPFENSIENEEKIFRNRTRTKTHDGSQKMALYGKRSYIFDSQSKRVNAVDSEGEEEFRKTLKKDRRENLSPKINKASRDDTVKEKPKILRLNIPNGISSHGQSRKTPISERISNILQMYPAEKNSINMRPHSATKGKKIKSQTIERKEEITSATGTTIDDRRYKFDKLSNNSLKETRRSTRIDRVASSKSNGRIHRTSERDDTNSYHENSNAKVDRINATVSRLAPEKNVTKNERTFALRMTDVSEKEKERKFSSRLPIRIWKRLRTKEPIALRVEYNATNGDISRKFQEVENKSAKSSDPSERVENYDRVKDRAVANHSDIKRSERFGTESLSADKPGLTSSKLKSVKGIKGSDTTRGTQREKRMSVK